jgi:hypothetical protein
VAADTSQMPYGVHTSLSPHPARPAHSLRPPLQPHTASQQSLVATPDEIHESLPDPDVAGDLLLQNKWLSVLLLIHLFVMPPRVKRARKLRGEEGGLAGTSTISTTRRADLQR